MKILSMAIDGLKGDRRADVNLSAPLLVVGPNGTGKSRISDALDFVLGRRVAGVATDAAQLRSAVGRSGACVSIRVIDDEGREHTISRRRDIDAKSGTFGRSVLTIDGARAPADDALTALLGDVSQPTGESWLSMSPEQIAASLARIGAASGAGAKRVDEIRERVAAVLGDDTPKSADPVAWLTEARDRVKGAANKAKQDATAAEKSAEQSRVDSAAENVTPERLHGLEAARDAALAEADAATQRRAQAAAAAQSAQRQRESARKAIADARAAFARATEEDDHAAHALARAERELGAAVEANDGGVTADTVGILRAELADIEASVAAAKQAKYDAKAALATADQLLRERMSAEDNVRQRWTRAREEEAHIAGGSCPTCTQSVGPALLAQFTAAVGASEQLLRAAEALTEEASAYVRECKDACDEAYAYFDDCESALCDVRNRLHAAEVAAAQSTDAVIAGLRARRDAAIEAQTKANEARVRATDALDAVQREHAGTMSAPDDYGAQISALDLDVERATQAHRSAQAAVDGARMAGARYLRWREDLARRDAARTRKEAVDAAMDAIRAAESALAELGFDAIRRDTDIPEHIGGMAYIDGAIGLRDVHGAFVSGAGLSGAQRTMLAHAIDHGLDDVTGRACRIVTLEADPLDAESLRVALDELASRHASGELAAVVVTTCHAPEPRILPGLFRVRTASGGDIYAVPEYAGAGADAVAPVADVHVAVSPEAVDEVMAASGPVAMSDEARIAWLPPLDDDPSAGCPDCEETCEHMLPDVPALSASAPEPARCATASAPAPVPTSSVETESQPTLFAMQAPAWLTKPGDVMTGGGPVDAIKDAARAALDGLSTGALEYLTEWGGRGAVPDPRPAAVSHAVVNELIEAQILTEDPFDCRLTPGGEWAWRILHDVEPVRSDAKATREDRIAPDGTGATADEIEGALKRGNLSVDALRYLGITRGGLDAATKRSVSLWRRHVVQAFHRRGYTLEFVERWITEAAEKHPKKARGASTETDADTDD